MTSGTEGRLPIEHLGQEAAELLSLTSGGEARSLNKLAELAAWQVPACSGAHAAVWYDGEVISVAATHPDLAELADLQLRAGTRARWPRPTRGPRSAARTPLMRTAGQNTRRRRCAAASAARSTWYARSRTVPWSCPCSVCGPGVLDAQSNLMADTLAAFGRAMLTNARPMARPSAPPLSSRTPWWRGPWSTRPRAS